MILREKTSKYVNYLNSEQMMNKETKTMNLNN